MSAGYMLLYSHVLHLDIIYVQCVYVCVYVYIHIYIYNMSTKTKWSREALKYWIYKKMKEKKYSKILHSIFSSVVPFT